MSVETRIRAGLAAICGSPTRGDEVYRAMQSEAKQERSAMQQRLIERSIEEPPADPFDRFVEDFVMRMPSTRESAIWHERAMALHVANGGTFDQDYVRQVSPRLAAELEHSGGVVKAKRPPIGTRSPDEATPSWWIEPESAEPAVTAEPWPAAMRRGEPTAQSPTIRVSRDAYTTISDAAWGQTTERGGGLIGWLDGDAPTVVEATATSSDGTEHTMTLNYDAVIDQLDAWADETGSTGAIRLVGDWHTHPDRSTDRPSATDVRGWLAILDDLNQRYSGKRAHYFGVVAGPAYTDEWGNWHATKLSAWVVHRDRYGGAVCERAHLIRT
jgi:hypothetical protein